MRILSRYVTSFLLATAIASPIIATGCAARVSTGYRVHDPYYRDDHVWNDNEVTFYSRWEGENHRDHVDYRKRSKADQNAYWDWRHNQH